VLCSGVTSQGRTLGVAFGLPHRVDSFCPKLHTDVSAVSYSFAFFVSTVGNDAYGWLCPATCAEKRRPVKLWWLNIFINGLRAIACFMIRLPLDK
jgi:hypothetical protein